MALNTYAVTEAMASRTLPLRGDMAATLNFIPADGFFFEFSIDEPGTYVISSSAAPIRGFNDIKSSVFSMTGGIGIFAKFIFDKTEQCWKITESNLVGAGVSAGGGSGGVTPVITAVATTLAAGSQATAVMSGPAATPTLTLGIPQGAKGNPGASGDGTGGSAGSPELEIFADENGNVTMDAADGNNFRLVVTGPVKLLNPVGFEDTSGLLRIKIVMGPDAPYAFAWDTAWGFDDGQPPIMPTEPGAIAKVEADLTNGDLWLTEIRPKGSTTGFAGITPLARIGNTQYYRMFGTLVIPSNTTAMGAAVDGDVIVIQRNGKGGEVTGTVQDKSVIITGALPSGGRATLSLGLTDFLQGQPNRPSFNKALLNFEGTGNSEVRDLILENVRNMDGDSRGLAPNGNHSLTVRNVLVRNCNNGMMWGSGYTGSVRIYDSVFDGNGVGSPDAGNSHGTGSSDGYVHNIYAGDAAGIFIVDRTSLLDSKTGHNLKTRCGQGDIKQTLCKGAKNGRELDLPWGGRFLFEDCIFWKVSGSTQGNLMLIGGEGIVTSRTREYIFRNCRFVMEYGAAGQDATFMVNKDPTVPVTYIDCEWVGDYTNTMNGDPTGDAFYAGMTTIGGDRYFVAPIKQFTNGPIGPRSNKPVGYFPVANTAVA